MIKIFDTWRDGLNFPAVILAIAFILGCLHLFTYWFPFTDNAFVVTNTQPVAADVSGYITQLYVENGQQVKKGDPLFRVFDTPYQLTLAKAQANYEEVLAHIEVVKEETKKNHDLLNKAKANLANREYEYSLKAKQLVHRSISKLTLQTLRYDIEGLKSQVKALTRQLVIDDKQIIQLEKKAKALNNEVKNARVNLLLTTVRAGSDGIIDNLYLSPGTAIIQHQPLFSLVSTDNWYIQANFNETDLRHVRPHDKVIIVTRMYYFNKIFHGEVVNHVWAANRQLVNDRTQQQTIQNVNEWLNLPQRIPVQIKILDPDPKYPLHPGMSAYVYIRT